MNIPCGRRATTPRKLLPSGNTGPAPASAVARGEWCTIPSDRGAARLRAHTTVRIRKDTVSADHGWWFPERGPEDGTLFGTLESNINQLVPMRPGKSGLGASYKSQLCRIAQIEA